MNSIKQVKDGLLLILPFCDDYTLLFIDRKNYMQRVHSMASVYPFNFPVNMMQCIVYVTK